MGGATIGNWQQESYSHSAATVSESSFLLLLLLLLVVLLVIFAFLTVMMTVELSRIGREANEGGWAGRPSN